MIQVEDLAKHYRVHVRESGFWQSLGSVFHREFRTVRAVDGLSFEIPEGQIVGFLGPNGAGKTTTMKVLSGLLHPTSGRVRVAGYVPSEHARAFKKRISLVMGQKSQLVWDIPAEESFLVNKAIYDIPDRIYRTQLDELRDLLQLDGLLNKPVRQLSLGERMKCELAASLLHQPDVIFLDEPTIGLDVNMQEAVRGFIGAYNRLHNATILLTSHYMADVTALCERVMVINHGKLLYDGAIARLVERFAPVKHIRLLLSSPVEEAALRATLEQEDARLIRYAHPDAEFEVRREDVSRVSARLLAALPIQDLTIEDPSMESVISRAFDYTEGEPGE